MKKTTIRQAIGYAMLAILFIAIMYHYMSRIASTQGWGVAMTFPIAIGLVLGFVALALKLIESE